MNRNQRREPNKRKPIREIQGRRHYSGEGSPYWEFLSATQRSTEEGMPIEDVLANPDVLSEEHSMYSRGISEDGEIRLRAIKETIPLLSKQQKKVLELCGMQNYTLESTAELLGVKLATVQTLLNRMRVKIQRRYEQLKAAEE